MPYIEIINAIFILSDFVMKKIKENKDLKDKDREELIKYFEIKFKDINDKLKPLSR